MEQQGQSVVPGLGLTEILDKRRNEVWRAVNSVTGNSAAVKLLNPAYEPIVPTRIGKQNRTLAKILGSTSGWVPLFDVGFARDGRRYVTMPFYHAGSLADQLEYGSTPWYPAASLIVGVATTIGGAHEAGWSFGRLRPSNVLLKSSDQPLVVVYGSATRRFDDGTAQFTAPEVAAGQPPTPTSDVYSLSLILASMIVGREIDCSESVDAILSEIKGHAPERIVEIVEYGLSPSLQNRYANATRMASALATVVLEPDPERESTDRTGSQSDIAPLESNNPLDDLLAGPLVASQQQDPAGDDTTPLGSEVDAELDDVESDAQTNHPELPAILKDLTIARRPRSATSRKPVGVTESSSDRGIDLAEPAADADEDTFLPGPEVVTASIGYDSQFDDLIAGPFNDEQGPLSDLLRPASETRALIDNFDDGEPTIDHHHALEARNEINQLIDQLGLRTGQTSSVPVEPDSLTHDEASSSDRLAVDTLPVGHDHLDDDTDDDGHDSGSEGNGNSGGDAYSDEEQPLERTPEIEAFVESTTTVTRPRRLWNKWTQNLVPHRRRILSSLTILCLTSIVGIALVAALQAVQSNGIVASEGESGADSQIEAEDDGPTADRSSPFNNLDHLEGLDSDSVKVEITAAPVRRRATPAVVASSSTTANQQPEDTGDNPTDPDGDDDGDGGDDDVGEDEPDQPTSTVDDATTTTSMGDDVSTSTPVPTNATSTTTTTASTTTTEATTTTKKRRGRRPRP